MSSVVIAGNTSGSVTLAAPDVAGTTTLTLPATSGTVVLANASGNIQFNSGYGSVATAYGCRAWVNFNGTGTIAIRASGNVTSITDNGTGDYTVNFTNAMPDANFCAACTTGDTTAANADDSITSSQLAKSTSSLRYLTGYTSGANKILYDYNLNDVAIFR